MILKLRIFFYKLPWPWHLIAPNTFLLIISVIAFWYPTPEDKQSLRMFSEDYLTVVDNWGRIMMAKMSPHLALAMCDHLTLQSFHSKQVLVITSSYGRNWADGEITCLSSHCRSHGKLGNNLGSRLRTCPYHWIIPPHSGTVGQMMMPTSIRRKPSNEAYRVYKYMWEKQDIAIYQKMIISMLKKIKIFPTMISIRRKGKPPDTNSDQRCTVNSGPGSLLFLLHLPSLTKWRLSFIKSSWFTLL